jgi:hypothetical protein
MRWSSEPPGVREVVDQCFEGGALRLELFSEYGDFGRREAVEVVCAGECVLEVFGVFVEAGS